MRETIFASRCFVPRCTCLIDDEPGRPAPYLAVRDGVHLSRSQPEPRGPSWLMMRRRQAVASMGLSAGEVVADIFTLLDENVHPADIVKRLELLPEIVSALHLQWTRMRAAFVMTADDADELGVHCRARRVSRRFNG